MKTFKIILLLTIGWSVGALCGLLYKSTYETEMVHPTQVAASIGEGIVNGKHFCLLGTNACITPRADGSGVIRVGWRERRIK
jgi:hypothetical protein